jgi:hypothetical protein
MNDDDKCCIVCVCEDDLPVKWLIKLDFTSPTMAAVEYVSESAGILLVPSAALSTGESPSSTNIVTVLLHSTTAS